MFLMQVKIVTPIYVNLTHRSKLILPRDGTYCRDEHDRSSYGLEGSGRSCGLSICTPAATCWRTEACQGIALLCFLMVGVSSVILTRDIFGRMDDSATGERVKIACWLL
jgi:hypothetical protein